MELRPSSYNIIIPTENKNEFAAIHGYTKAFDLIDKDTAKLLSNSNYKLKKDYFSNSQLSSLIQRGYITPETEESEHEKFKNYVRMVHRKKREKTRSSFVLMPTYLCNLNCFYCYQKPYVTSELKKQTISDEMIDNVFHAIKNELGDGTSNAILTLYGGEPLLKDNKDKIEKILKKAKELDLKVSAITNGTQIPWFLDLMGKEKGIAQLQITLDGDKEAHDKRRVKHDGTGTYETIVENIGKALETGVQINLRINVDKTNITTLKKIEAMIMEKEWHRKNNFSIYASDIHMVPDQEDFMERSTVLQQNELVKYIDENSKCITSIKQMVENIALTILNAEDQGVLRTGFCGANFKAHVFDPFGKIYACWDDVGTDKEIGSYLNGNIVLFENQKKIWHSSPVAEVENCSKCAYSLFCGGGCPSQATQNGEAFYNHFCESYKNIFSEVMKNGIKAIDNKIHKKHIA